MRRLYVFLAVLLPILTLASIAMLSGPVFHMRPLDGDPLPPHPQTHPIGILGDPTPPEPHMSPFGDPTPPEPH